MKNAGRSILFILFLILVFASCAKRGNPEGGPIDEEPPRFVRANPENFSINFDSEEIAIFFDEYITLEEAQRQIIISPPMEYRPQITPLGTASKVVKLEIFDTLQENTTYSINFGQSIVDNNEGNPLPFFRYVFSTGSYIDSLSLSGSVTDAYYLQADPFISVMLYEVDSTYTDSTVYNTLPRYITNTLDSLTTFQLNNLKAGTYKLVALKDQNNNYMYEPESDKIGFLEDYVTIPNDSVFNLSLFKEKLPFEFSPRPPQVAQQHIIFGYEGDFKQDSIQIELQNPKPEGFETRIVKDLETDTLHYWYKPNIEADSLNFIVRAPNYQDTLITRLQEMESDSLQISFEPSGTVNFNQEVKIIPNIPIAETQDSLMSLKLNDSIPIPFSLDYNAFKNRLILDFEKQEDQNYNFQVLPGAITDFFGNINDTLQAQFSTKNYSDYGSVTINLQNVRQYPIIVQLTNEEGEVQAEQYSDSESSFTFQYLNPESYLLRIIYDRNSNRVWDTGDYLLDRQPEEIIYFPTALDVRANWEINQSFTLP